nr:MAG TPA: putative YmpT-like protein [Caudoviricetes sp.]
MSYALFIDISCFMWHGKDKNKKLEKTCVSQKSLPK